jgi:phosphoglycolate phosphatase-like HAD superfamily hydrolase
VIVVFDIDGVLADATHRQHFVERRPKDWDAFFAAVGEDPVIEAGRDRLLAESVDHEVVLLSGRPESTRADTQEWLERHGMGDRRLVLRSHADHRPAATLKAELIRGIGDREQIERIIDDDASVVQRLASQGYVAELFR